MNIYHEDILDHYHNPRNRGNIKNATHSNCGLNPTCGDKICMNIKIEKNIIADIQFSGDGCAISQAAASMLCEEIFGKPVATLKKMGKDGMLELLGLELSPNRLKCGLLALETAHEALEGRKK